MNSSMNSVDCCDISVRETKQISVVIVIDLRQRPIKYMIMIIFQYMSAKSCHQLEYSGLKIGSNIQF